VLINIPRPTVARAIKALAQACDHAQARDDSGFSKSTAGPGHELAALGQSRWNDEMWTYATRLAAHHAHQLLKAHILSDEEFEELKALKERGLKSPFLPTNWADLSEIDGRAAIVVSNSFSKVLTTVLERFPVSEAFRPAGSGRLWRISSRFAFVLADHLEGIDLLNEDVRDMVRSSLAAATPDDRALGHHGPIVQFSEGVISFRMAFDAAFHAELKNSKGGRINVGKSWQDVTYTIAPDRRGYILMQAFLAGGFNPALRDDVLDEIARIEHVDPASVVAQQRTQDEPVLDIRYDEASDVVLIKFRPFHQPWLDAIKALPADARAYRDGEWKVDADRRILVQLAEGISNAGREAHHSRAAIAIHELIAVPVSTKGPSMS
jgi:frataxin-like iron-binding protein CyaY